MLFACLFAASFFVGYAVFAAVTRIFVSVGFWVCLLELFALAAAVTLLVRKGIRAARVFVKTQGAEGVVIYPDLKSFAAACLAVLLMVFWDAGTYALAFFAVTGACVVFCAISACRYNKEAGVLLSSLVQMAFPLALPVLSVFIVCMTLGRRPDSRLVEHFHKKDDEAGLTDYMETIDAQRRSQQQKRSAAFHALFEMTVANVAIGDDAQTRQILQAREERSELSMTFALLPIAFLIAARLFCGPDGTLFLKKAFTERIFVQETMAPADTKSNTEDLHQNRAYFDAV